MHLPEKPLLPNMIKEEYGLEPMDETYEEKTIELLKKFNLTYEHMVLQLEDCIDVLRCLYPQYDVL